MNKLLCSFGFHRWQYSTYRFIWHNRVCRHCGKHQKTHDKWKYWEDI